MIQNKVIFFDFDGVIANSLQIAFEVNQLSKPTLTLELYRSYFDGNINDAIHADEVLKKIDFFEEYGKRFEKLEINKYTKSTIEKLSQEYQLFIISSTRGDIIQSYLQRHEILSCFTEILGNEIEKSKIKKFQILFDKYNINQKDIIFITDTSGDIKEAKKVGIETIVGIIGGYQFEENLKKENPTIIVENFTQFYDFVKEQM